MYTVEGRRINEQMEEWMDEFTFYIHIKNVLHFQEYTVVLYSVVLK